VEKAFAASGLDIQGKGVYAENRLPAVKKADDGPSGTGHTALCVVF
jgi:hypothetical protein